MSLPTIPSTYVAGPGYYEARAAEAAVRSKPKPRPDDEKESLSQNSLGHYSVYGLFGLLKEKPIHPMTRELLLNKMKQKECLPEVIKAYQFLVDAKKFEDMTALSKLLLSANWTLESIQKDLIPRLKWNSEAERNQFVTKALASLMATQELLNTGIQRKIKAEQAEVTKQLLHELHSIQTQLNDSGMKDEMSNEIASWCRDFTTALASKVDPKIVLGKFIIRMQELLKDPLALTSSHSLAPLDDRTLYGSDGRTYGYMTYSLYLISAPSEFRERSPLEPNNEKPFIVNPHFNVRFMINWLKTHDAQLHCPEIVDLYDQLSSQKVLPAIATTDHERRRQRILARQAQLDRELASQPEALDQETMSRVQSYSQERFAQLHQDARESYEKDLKRVELMSQNDKKLKEIQDRAIEKLEKEAEALKNDLQELRNKKKELEGEIGGAHQDLNNLETTMNEARAALKERDKAWVKDLLITASIIAGCYAGTLALQQYGLHLFPLPRGLGLGGSRPI